MRVLKAEYAGACYGVQRALDMAYGAVPDGGTAYTLGPLIHNPQVVKSLEEHRIVAVGGLADIGEGTVIIRSHGAAPQVKAEAEAKGLTVVDATCPYVARAQKAAASLAAEGYQVVIVGESGHPEVEGMRAYAAAEGCEAAVVADPAGLPEDIEGPVGVVVQTTQTEEALGAVVAALEGRGLNPLVRDTICLATRQRQEAAARLAEATDAIVVIGGRNSSNTSRLFEICKARCPKSYHIEAPDEIDASWFEGCKTVGVTAGASTPESQIDAVVACLEAL